jgi:hypothetical protein
MPSEPAEGIRNALSVVGIVDNGGRVGSPHWYVLADTVRGRDRRSTHANRKRCRSGQSAGTNNAHLHVLELVASRAHNDIRNRAAERHRSRPRGDGAAAVTQATG